MANRKGRVSLVLEGYIAYSTQEGKKRYRNINNPKETISRYEFSKRAKRVVIPPKVKKPSRRVSLKLAGFEAFKNERGTRRYRQISNPEVTISQRQFRKLAHAEIDPEKRRERGVLYRTYVNRQMWFERETVTPHYMSTEEAMDQPEFLQYEEYLDSNNRELQDLAYEFYDELYDLYVNKDWGDTE